MPISLLASQCPLPVIDTSHTKLSDAENTAGTGVPSARSFAAGNTVISSKLNRNAAQMDLQGRYGGGGYGIVNGLAISAGSGLTLNIAAGQAAIDGIIEIAAATTLAVPDNHPSATDRVWIWLSRAGAISYTLNTTPPATNCCLLGSCTTSGGVITAVDQSGVMYLKNNTFERETADTGPPTDSPNAALRFQTKTKAGRFFWDGSSHLPLYEPLQKNIMSIASTEADKIESGEQVILTTTLIPFTVDGTLTIDGELHLL